MRLLALCCLLPLTTLTFELSVHAADGEIRLLVRADDMGSSHSANLACIDSFKNGIVRSVELMPACPWFPEAVEILKSNPGLDVGIHLALTSEWSRYKWRPLTDCPSLVDADGYFFPMVWKNSNFPPKSSIQESDWKIEEIEQELRAQIELALKYVPQISHMGGHMGFGSLDRRIGALLEKLTKEYKLEINFERSQLKRFPGWGDTKQHERRIDVFCQNLRKMTPGTYLFVEHPAWDSPEMRPIMHVGYETVALDREWVAKVFTSKKVIRTIESKGIKLISYRDLKENSTMNAKVIRTEEEWKKLLTREQYHVLRQQGTEAPFRNKFDEHFQPGTYSCAACGAELFDSNTKFNSGCGWPAFYAAMAGDRVILRPDYSGGRTRTEVICARCDSHLGHVFADAPQTPTGQRFCINSVSLKFTPEEQKKP